eukprot:5840250-Pyramimonas_sp.AAC.1
MAIEILQDNYLNVYDTYWKMVPTYFQDQHSSNIDHVAGPASVRERTRRLNALLVLGRRLQRYASAHLHDH